jgi:prepilin-type N-terminal cleavage/methylation domain-containing protein
MARKSKDAPPAFTLVELLVVITIVAVLAAAGFALVPMVRAKALMAADIQKLRDIGGALASFTGDFNNSLPNDSANNRTRIPGANDQFVFHEQVDRYLGTVPNFNPTSNYNFLKRPNSPFFTKAISQPGFKPKPDRLGLVAFSYHANVNSSNWEGRLNKIPNPAEIVCVAECNINGSGQLFPDRPACFESNQDTRYRVSRPGQSGLYLFCDFHVETLKGDRGYSYYSSHKNEKNIWRWW